MDLSKVLFSCFQGTDYELVECSLLVGLVQVVAASETTFRKPSYSFVVPWSHASASGFPHPPSYKEFVTAFHSTVLLVTLRL